MLKFVGAKQDHRQRGMTAAMAVCEALREDILALRRKPGAQLNELDIAASHGVSRTPVREAFLRLSDEGLIDIVSKSGTYVSRIPLADLPEAILIRSALEQLTVRAAVQRGTKSQLIELAAILARSREAEAAGDRDAFHRSDEMFHEAIAVAGGLRGVWALVKQVKTQVDRFRRLTLPIEGRMAMVIAEHSRILKAIDARDADRAVAAMKRHIDGLRRGLDDVARFNPDFFEEAHHSIAHG